MRINFKIMTVLLFTAMPIYSGIAAGIPKGGESVLTKDLMAKHYFGPEDKTASLKISGKKNNPLLSINSSKRRENFYQLQLVLPTVTGVSKGDVMLIAFKARTLSSDNNDIGAFQVYFQKNAKDWEKSISMEIRIADGWKTIYIPFKAGMTLGKGQAALCMGFGLHAQKIELTDLKLLNYKKKLKIKDLPKFKPDVNIYAYKGMSLDASWRKEASKRIEKLRKADIKVKVTKDGKVVEGAKISIKMKRHAFPFGSAFAMRYLRQDSKNAKIYQEKILELFNSGGPENALKWLPLSGAWGPKWQFQNTKKSLEWLKKHNIKTRGHVLLWPSWKHTPKSLKDYEKNHEKLKSAIDEHIEDITKKCEPYIYEWDVINEPFNNNDLMKVLGDEVMAEWFVAARKNLPDTKLYLNDFHIISKPAGEHYESFKKTVEQLLAAKAPIDGLGLQSHFGSSLRPPEDLLKTLDDLAQYKLEIKITEFDVDSPHRELLANYTRDFLTVVFSHPSIKGFQMWGFWEGAHWKPDGAMYDQNWTERENLTAYKKLVFKDWWTDLAGKSDKAGSFATRGFLGDYEITVSLDGKEKTVQKALLKSGLHLDVNF